MKNVRADRYGLRAYVKVHGRQREKRFPAGTPPKTIRAWQDEARVALRALAPEPTTRTGLVADVESYLEQVRTMPTYAQRRAHLEAWVAALGHPLRQAITANEVRRVLQQWRLTLSAATCNKRRTALLHLFSVLDGKGARNPVRDVPKFRVADALPRGRDPHEIDRALRAAPRCRSRACCRVLLWTGMRPVELQRAEPDDLNLRDRLIVVRTAKGGRARVVPLTPQGVRAWTEFDAADAWHHVPQAAPLNRWLKKITGLAIRVYDLRHTYGTALAKRQTRLDVIAALMGHSTMELSKRYVLAAVSEDALAATARLETASRPASGRPVRVARRGRS